MAAGSGFRTEMTFEYGVPRQLAPGVNRIVACNPGPYTFKGTNTYLVGEKRLGIIDPGPEDAAHLAAILKAVDGREVTHILVTHRHRDHTGGAVALKAAVDAPIFAFGPISFAAPSNPGSSGGGLHRDLAVDTHLADGAKIVGDGWTLDAIHTPGHLSDHISYRMREQPILFSGDHVMGWNTSVVAPPNGNMRDYLASLEKLLDDPSSEFYPGHGGRINEPRRTLRALLLHRQWREQAIIESIEHGNTTISAIVADVYHGLDTRLVRGASLSVQAHIEHLAERGLVLTALPVTFESEIVLLKR